MEPLLTPGEIARQLTRLGVELHEVVKKLKVERTVLVVLKRDYREKYAKAWLATSGIAESRKQEATLACATELFAMETSITEIEKYADEIRELDRRISIGQTIGKQILAEMNLAGGKFSEYA